MRDPTIAAGDYCGDCVGFVTEMCSPSCYKSWLNSFRMRIHTPVDWIKAHRFPKFDFCFGRSDFFDEGRRSRISKIAFRWFFGSCVFFTRVEIQFWCEFQKLLFVDFLVRVFFFAPCRNSISIDRPETAFSRFQNPPWQKHSDLPN
jgi:hypothetical protein